MTAVCKTWAVAAKDFKPLCTNNFQPTNNLNACDVCVHPTVYDPTDGIVLGACGCSPTTGEIERSWVLKVEQGPIWSTLSATEQALLSCYLGTFALTNNTLAWYAANGVRLAANYATSYSSPGCVITDSEVLSPPSLEFLCSVWSYAKQPAGPAAGSGNICTTYPFSLGGSCLWPVPKFNINLAGTVTTLSGKTYRGVSTAWNYYVSFVYGGRSGPLLTQLPAALCNFYVPGKLPACSTSEQFTYRLVGQGFAGDIDHWNNRFIVTLSGS